jgi:hypothetical protein
MICSAGEQHLIMRRSTVMAQILEANTKVSVGTATRVLYAEDLDPRLIQPQLDIAAKYALIPHDLPAASLIAAFAGAPTGAGARS